MEDNNQTMSQNPILKIGNLTISAIAITIIITGCLLIGVAAQDASLQYLVLGSLALVAWLFYAIHTTVSLQSTLLIVALFLIKPLEINFYLIILLLMFVFCAELIMKERLSLIIPYPSAMAFLIGFGVYSATKISNPAGITYFVSTVIIPFVVLTLFRNAKTEPNMMANWMKYIVWIATFVAAYGIVIAIQNPFKRLGSFWFTAMTINGFYTVGFFFAVTFALRNKRKFIKSLYALMALCIMFGMLYTYTRMAILAVAVGMILYMIRIKRIRLLGIILLAFVPLIIPSSMITRIELGFQSDISLVIRAIAWYIAVGQIIKQPLTGMGFSVWADWYHTIVPVRMLYAQHCHNVFLNMMVEMGIIGTIAYFSIVTKIIRQFWRVSIMSNSDILPFGMWVAVISLLFACLTDIFIQQYSISLMFWVCLGLMMSLSKESTTE
jgi:O-antigen ligase